MLLALLLACAAPDAAAGTSSGTTVAPPVAAGQAVAVFASGCFWCSESDFEKAPGVISVQSGYAGGPEANPTYEQVGSGRTGHAEAVRVVYDPARTSYPALLAWYWRHVDPFDGGGQFCDRGKQYRPAIFPQDATQRKDAEASKVAIEQVLRRPVAVTIEAGGPFYVAEAYHQDFYKTNPARYTSYRSGCGRDARVKAVWAGVSGQ
ncbi:MAG: peptide methionine sulfoxide reductase MsrA [Pseudomonadota bacterium]|jgi:peptide-methionine (S)-S-oxide reductase